MRPPTNSSGRHEDIQGAAAPTRAGAWHGDAGAGISRPTRSGEGSRPVPDLLRFLAPARPAQRHGRAAGEVRRHQPHRSQHPAAGEPAGPKLPANYLPAHPFPPPGHPTSATRRRPAVCGRIATSAPSATRSAASSRAARTSTSRSAGCSGEARGDGRTRQHLHLLHLRPRHRHRPPRVAGKAEPLPAHLARAVHREGSRHQAGLAREGNIYLLDVLATLCDLAGISAAETNEGISFRPVLEGRHGLRDVLYGVSQRRHQARDAVREKGRLETHQVRRQTTAGARDQLFNLADNPGELLQEHHDPAGDRADR